MKTVPYYYNAGERPWQSPIATLKAYGLLQSVYGTNLNKGQFKKVREGFSTAILLLGLFRIQGITYFMQACRDRSPDYFTLRQTERTGRPILGEFVEVEVVSYDKNSHENNVVDFLKRTKFSKAKSYDSMTVILCEVSKKSFISPLEINNLIAKFSPPCHIYLLGKIDPKKFYLPNVPSVSRNRKSS